MATHPDKNCEICDTVFTPVRRTGRTCSLDCSIQLRRKVTREAAARRYKPRAPRPDFTCGACGALTPTPKMGAVPLWCGPCRAMKADERARKRIAVRRCYKCQAALPGAKRQPGVAVCDDCRTDPRKHRRDSEHRRRLRRYGLDQDRYDQLVADQDGKCASCRTTDPGAKGWCIDHNHRTGRVRALLCNRCNTMLGLADEDPAVLRALADFAERQLEIDRDKDMV